jgi:subtilisin-like proprotein convertase family protein
VNFLAVARNLYKLCNILASKEKNMLFLQLLLTITVKMKRNLLVLATALLVTPVFAQQHSAWQKLASVSNQGSKLIRDTQYSQRQQLLSWNEALMRSVLSEATEVNSGGKGVEIILPSVDGVNEEYLVWETSNFAPGLRERYPEIKSFVGKGVTDPTAYLRFSLDPRGIQTMVLRADKGAEFIEPYTTDHSVYVLFDSKTRSKGNLPFVCSTDDRELNTNALNRVAMSDDQTFRTYDLALSCTGEYGQFFGGTVAGALAGMNATMTRVNGVFEVDLAIKLEIIDGDEAVIYTMPSSDPYSAAGTGTNPANTNNANGWNIQLQNTLTAQLGNAAYDIGHLFGASGGGGNAGCIGCVCEDDTPNNLDKNKGSGYTSPGDGIPQGDNFDIDYVIHEMGHQLGANHTFSHNYEGSGVQVEPGSGVTIMGYAGITGPYDVQSNSEPFFAYRSLLQIQSNIDDKTCSVDTPLANNPPVVNAGANYVIPKGTAFILKGTGSDPDGDALTFVWEQNDNATGSVDGDQSFPSPTKTVGPNFRSFLPTASPDRYMPRYSAVLAGHLTTTWETVSTVARQLNFNFTARDNRPGGGQTKKDAMVVTVSGSTGPFEVTSQNTVGLSWLQNTQETVTWAVNNANTLTGSANVNIKLSLDAGQTWPVTLAANTPNDGSEVITVPNVTATNCRLMIEPVGNIYYAVNAREFAIGYTVTQTCNTYSWTTSYSISSTMPTVFIDKTLNVPTGGVISDVNLSYRVHHTYMSDVNTALASPSDPTNFIQLQSSNCGDESGALSFKFTDDGGTIDCGLIVPTSTVTAPVQDVMPHGDPLASFNGQNPQGDWKFRVYDHIPGDNGSIRFWNLEICTQNAQLANPGFDFVDFALYPNPNQGNFTVQFTSESTNEIKIKVHDMRGRTILERGFENTGSFMENIQLPDVETGIYLVSVQDGEKKIVKRIVVE